MTTSTTVATLFLAVVGSRTYPLAMEHVRKVLWRYREDFPGVKLHVVSGGAVGVDRAAVEHARRLGMDYTVYQPQWKKYGKVAGFIRNDLILDDADRVLAFWDFRSRGTLDTLRKAWRRNLPIEVYDVDGQPAGLKARDLLEGWSDE